MTESVMSPIEALQLAPTLDHSRKIWRDPVLERPIRDITESVVSTEDIAVATDRITTARVLQEIARERRLSLTGRMAHLTSRAQDFHKKTESILDGIEEKINKADTKLNIANEKHHTYYDGIIAGVDESVAVVDRLSNGPLPEGGEG